MSTHIHLCSKATSAPAPSISQEVNDRVSTELWDGHTEIPNLELQYRRVRLEAATLLDCSQLFICFVGKKLYWWDVFIILSSPQEKEDFDSCCISRLLLGLAKVQRLSACFCAS